LRASNALYNGSLKQNGGPRLIGYDVPKLGPLQQQQKRGIEKGKGALNYECNINVAATLA